MQAPPLRAVVPPLRESRWAPEWQRKILQRELLPLSFYRRLVGCDEAEQRLLNLLETEFDTLVTDGSSATVGHVYALQERNEAGHHACIDHGLDWGRARFRTIAGLVVGGPRALGTPVNDREDQPQGPGAGAEWVGGQIRKMVVGWPWGRKAYGCPSH